MLTKSQIKQKLADAWKNLRLVQKQHKELREEHLEQLADHYVTHRNTTREQEIKNIQHVEGVKRIASKHKWYLKGLDGNDQATVGAEVLRVPDVPYFC